MRQVALFLLPDPVAKCIWCEDRKEIVPRSKKTISNFREIGQDLGAYLCCFIDSFSRSFFFFLWCLRHAFSRILGKQRLNFEAAFNLIKKRDNGRRIRNIQSFHRTLFSHETERSDCSGRKMWIQCDHVITFRDEDYGSRMRLTKRLARTCVQDRDPKLACT